MKKKVLFVMPGLYSGGAEKSLVNLLNLLDYSKLDVDLLLFKKEGLFMNQVPSEVNILNIPISLKYSYSPLDTPYLDSGIFLMNLLYSCTYYGIDTCPLIWDDYGEKGTELRRILPIGKNMHVIAVIQIGEHRENSVHAISHRRPVEDVFIEI